MENIPKTGYFTQKYKLILSFIHNILHLITCKKNTQKTIQNKCLSLILKIMVPMVTILLLFIKGRKVFFVEIFFSYFRKSCQIRTSVFFLTSIYQYCFGFGAHDPMVCEENIEILILNRR